MRAWIAAAVIAVIADVGWAAPTTTVDLNAPGALDRLRRADPDEYAKVVSIVRRAEFVANDFDRMVKVRYGGSGGFASPIARTTFPPQRDFTFTLGERTYHGRTGLRMQAEMLRAGDLPPVLGPRDAVQRNAAGP